MNERMGKWMTVLIGIAFVISTTLTGCDLYKEKDEETTLLIAGSSDFLTLTKILQTEFEKQYPNDHIISQGGGTIPGILSLKNDAIDIAISARDLEKHEDDKNIKSILIAKDALLIVTNLKNRVNNLSVDQVQAIYSGEIINWKEVGGEDARITVLTREPSSTTLGSLKDMVMEGEDVTEEAIAKESADVMQEEISRNPNAIGFVSMKHFMPIVKQLKVENVEATKFSILSGRYPISRSFFLVVQSQPEDLAKRFVEFVVSDQGQSILEKSGALRVY